MHDVAVGILLIFLSGVLGAALGLLLVFLWWDMNMRD